MKIRPLMLFPVVLTISSCATPVQYVATGGSRADATVELSYQYGMYSKPVTNEVQGIGVASERCRVWGYDGADPFGASISNCVASNVYGACTLWRATKTYQCTGDGTPQ